MEAITLSIDETPISAPAGQTILQAARTHDIYIPTLCHHEALRSIGACRLCQVEWLERGVVVPACVTQVIPGMSILTDSERIRTNRRNIVRLLMSAHPESCLVCEKGNTCELRKLAAELGVGDHGLDRLPYTPGVMDLNPFMARDLSKCIMCQKCLRADQDLVVEGVIDYNLRGFEAHPATLFAKPLEESACTFCGTCLSVCPTGAIFEKNRLRLDHGTQATESICSYCACGCAISLEHDHISLCGVSPSPAPNTANSITLCVRGHFGHDYMVSKERITTPLIKTETGFTPISWEDAVTRAAEGLGSVLHAKGPDYLGFIGGARASNEENYLLGRMAREVIGTNNLDNASRLYWAGAAQTLMASTGFAAGTCSMADLSRTGLIFLAGGDPAASSPVAGYHLKRACKNGAKLIILDSGANSQKARADLLLKPKPGREAAVLLALAKEILEQDLADHKFVAAKTRGFETFKQQIKAISPVELAQKAGLALDDIRQAAEMFDRAGRAVFILGQGLMQRFIGPDLVRMIINLALLTGNLGREGAGVLPLLTDCNTQGALDMGISPAMLPGGRMVKDGAARDHLSRLWGKKPPGEPGLDYFQMIGRAGIGRLKAMYILAEDPLTLMPDRGKVEKAFSRLSFLMVQDLFLSETARMADLVLPASAPGEKDGSFTSLERRVQKLTRALPTPGDYPGETDFIINLAKALGANWSHSSPNDIFNEIEVAAPIYQGMAQAFRNGRPAFWPLPGNEWVSDTLPHGIGLADGRAVFQKVSTSLKSAAEPKRGFPYLLRLEPVLPHLGGGLLSGQSKRLSGIMPEARLRVSLKDCERLGLKEGSQVSLSSHAAMISCRVICDSSLDKGMLVAGLAPNRPGFNRLIEHNWRGKSSPAASIHVRVSMRKARSK